MHVRLTRRARLGDVGGVRRPRVLFVVGRLDPGRDGVADYVVRLAEALGDRGASPRILHVGDPAAVLGSRTVGRSWGPRALLRAVGAARGADVVHVQFAPSMYRYRIGVGLLPVLLRRPLITTLHEYGWWRWEALLPARLWRSLESLRLADRETGLLVPRSRTVIATNAAHADAVRRRFARPPAVEVVPIGANVSVAGGIDPVDARRQVRAEIGIAPDAVLLAFFGFVHPVKGVRYLAEAVAALAAEGRDVHAVVVGGIESLALPGAEADDFERDLHADVAAAGAADRLHITGFRQPPDVSRLLAAADAGVLPFTHGVTAKSGSLLTLLAHGLPTVVTAGDEPEPELEDGHRVAVVRRVRDGAALAAGLRRVLDDPQLAAGLATEGAAWAATRDWTAIADRHLVVYADAR
jgi:glycosyltransferase involved in cell wall biosynthesis